MNDELRVGQKWVHKRFPNDGHLQVLNLMNELTILWVQFEDENKSRGAVRVETLLETYNLDETHNVKSILSYYKSL